MWLMLSFSWMEARQKRTGRQTRRCWSSHVLNESPTDVIFIKKNYFLFFNSETKGMRTQHKRESGPLSCCDPGC